MAEIAHHMVAGAPPPVAPFSHAVESEGWVYLTGQMPVGDDLSAPLPEGVEAQTHRVIANLTTVLNGLGLGLENCVFVRVYLTHFERDYQRMNAVYASYFAEGQRPGRTCVGVTGLALGALVEIDVVAKR